MASTLYQQRTKNVWRTAFLMAGFLAVVLAIGYAVSWYYESPGILYIAMAFAIFMNVWSYWFSDKQVLSMTGAKPANRDEYFDFYTVTENMAIAAGLPMP
ncbi:MAG: zinc metalloprotease HtpX, partial [Patescibacteria group bacterium]